jgi:hypothetical protein
VGSLSILVCIKQWALIGLLIVLKDRHKFLSLRIIGPFLLFDVLQQVRWIFLGWSKGVLCRAYQLVLFIFNKRFVVYLTRQLVSFN